MENSRFFNWNDPDSWTTLTAATTRARPTKRSVEDLLRRNYDGVIAYHACKPTDPSSYCQSRLICRSEEDFRKEIEQILLEAKLPLELLNIRSKAFETISKEGIFGCLDRRLFREECGHYLIYGSERLIKYSATLSVEQCAAFRDRLKKRGQPTILYIGLPWHLLDCDFIHFAQLVRKNWSKIFRRQVLPLENFAFEWSTQEPKIVFIESVNEAVPDPLEQMAPFTLSKPT